MDYRCLLVVLLCIYGVTWSQDEKNCDNYDSENDCYECNDDPDECISCSSNFEEADCDKCGCVYTAVAYVVSIIFWIFIYVCCGFCCKFFCCNDQNQPNSYNRNAPLLSKKSGNINSAAATKYTQKVVNNNIPNNITVEKLEGEGKLTKMKCSQCNKTYASECQFCSKCGATLQKEDDDVKIVNDNEIVIEQQIESDVPRVEYVKCQNCGKNNSTSFITHGCWKCGKPINIQYK
eukprot:48178_1